MSFFQKTEIQEKEKGNLPHIGYVEQSMKINRRSMKEIKTLIPKIGSVDEKVIPEQKNVCAPKVKMFEQIKVEKIDSADESIFTALEPIVVPKMEEESRKAVENNDSESQISESMFASKVKSLEQITVEKIDSAGESVITKLDPIIVPKVEEEHEEQSTQKIDSVERHLVVKQEPVEDTEIAEWDWGCVDNATVELGPPLTAVNVEPSVESMISNVELAGSTIKTLMDISNQSVDQVSGLESSECSETSNFPISETETSWSDVMAEQMQGTIEVDTSLVKTEVADTMMDIGPDKPTDGNLMVKVLSINYLI